MNEPALELFSRGLAIKLTGQGMADGMPAERGFSEKAFRRTANVLKSFQMMMRDAGFPGILVVYGGSNGWRGSRDNVAGLNGEYLHRMGMLTTGQNTLYLAAALEAIDADFSVYSVMGALDPFKEFDAAKARQDIAEGKIVLIAGGTGQTGWSADAGGPKWAEQLGIPVVAFGKNRTRGVFTDDPNQNPLEAEFLPEVTASRIIDDDLKVVDGDTMKLVRDHGQTALVFDWLDDDAVRSLLTADFNGSLVTPS